MDSVESVLNNFGKYVKQQSKSNLTKGKKRDTSALYDGINYQVIVTDNKWELIFTFGSADNYWEFVDQGVKGREESTLAPTSPFQYRDKPPPSNVITGWVTRKRFQFRKPNGKFKSYKTTAFLISRSIQKRGLKTTFFFTKPYEAGFLRVPEEVYAAYSLEVDKKIIKLLQ